VTELRIASFLPAATEMICALGLTDQLVGVSHECRYPPEAAQKPVVVRCAMDLASLNLEQIDKAVSERVGKGQSVYAVDEVVLQKISPNLIITQDLCQVCAPSGNEATQALMALKPKPDIIWQTPHSFEDVISDLKILAEKTGTTPKAEELILHMRQRIDKVRSLSKNLKPAKVFFMEWVDPVYCGGHWVPEMMQWAGGQDAISKPNVDSIRIPWEDVLGYDPDILIVSPCGFSTQDALKQAALLRTRPDWKNLSAVRNDRVYAVDANAYFACPGLRLVDGVEILAHLFHPKTFPHPGPTGAFAKL
jgi:iron complex transport system substrate-binding protein